MIRSGRPGGTCVGTAGGGGGGGVPAACGHAGAQPGRHRGPARGACFLEYTALLAGEPFSDHPAFVDGELSAVLRDGELSAVLRHECYEQVMTQLGLVGPPAVPVAAARSGA